MRAALFATLIATSFLTDGVGAKEIQNAVSSEMYKSGSVHAELMAQKMTSWQHQVEIGAANSRNYPSRVGSGPIRCKKGVAEVVPGDPLNTFRCNKVDFYDFISHADLGSKIGLGSSSWGWTSPDGREFVVIAQADGAGFAEITPKGKFVFLGRLPENPAAKLPEDGIPRIWREIRGYKNYIIVGTETENHGVQVFDMTKLLNINPRKPVIFDPVKDLTSFWNDLPVGRTHNIVVNEEKEYAVAVGAVPRDSACGAGLIFIDMKDPSNPKTLGCASGDGYVHDAQCLVYRGPDRKYAGRDICYGYNEDTLTIYDVTDKNTTNIISRTSYEGATFTHQGWVTNPDWQEYLVLDDEFDELNRTGPGVDGYPITYFWDIRSLENPKQTGFFRSPGYAIDHNQFVVDGFSYQSNYGAGFRILDVRSLPRDPTGALVREVGFFDVYPENDGEPNGGSLDFIGSWSNYPFFKSGYVLVNSITRGAFVVKRSH